MSLGFLHHRKQPQSDGQLLISVHNGNVFLEEFDWNVCGFVLPMKRGVKHSAPHHDLTCPQIFPVNTNCDCWKYSHIQNKIDYCIVMCTTKHCLHISGYCRGLQTSSALQSHAGEAAAAAGADEPGPESAEGGEPGPDGEQQLKEEILEASLPFVHSLGWSEDAIAQGRHTAAQAIHFLLSNLNLHTLP